MTVEMMTADKSLMDNVVAFIVREVGMKPDKVRGSENLLRDAGLDGDDAENFVRKFSNEFGIDMKDFDPSKYFGPEAGFVPLALLFPKWWKKRASLKPITVTYLVEIAGSRRWV